MEKKLGFRSVLSLVIGSQIGSGIFLLPASLALLGPMSLFGWCISGVGAILLALVFAQLSTIVAKAGGPHTYIERVFGRRAAFFAGWTYWVVSWVSSLAVIIAAVGYLSPILGIQNPLIILCLEMLLITLITLINIRGTTLAGSIEVFLTLMKCLPLILIPLGALFYFKTEHFFPLNPSGASLSKTLSAASLMTFWGFIGLETATVTSGIIENPKKTVPKAVILGTLIVALIYFFNSVSMMGAVPGEILARSQAPYVDATQIIFGAGFDTLIAIVAFIACVGTLNAWVLTSGQIAMQAAKDGLFPPLFSRMNPSGAPFISLLIPLFCTLFLLIFTLTPDILSQLNQIIDISVTIFLFLYLGCSAALLKMAFKEKIKIPLLYKIAAPLAILFCVWILSFTKLSHLLICSLFTISGIPIYYSMQKKPKDDIIAPA